MSKRGRPKADYKCEISGRVCPFNDEDWQEIMRDTAAESCPIKEYQSDIQFTPEGRIVWSNWCTHLASREEKTVKKRGRPKADYRCAISGRVCPFNDVDWQIMMRDMAADSCPIERYEDNDRIEPDGRMVISDWCKHLIPNEE